MRQLGRPLASSLGLVTALLAAQRFVGDAPERKQDEHAPIQVRNPGRGKAHLRRKQGNTNGRSRKVQLMNRFPLAVGTLAGEVAPEPEKVNPMGDAAAEGSQPHTESAFTRGSGSQTQQARSSPSAKGAATSAKERDTYTQEDDQSSRITINIENMSTMDIMRNVAVQKFLERTGRSIHEVFGGASVWAQLPSDQTILNLKKELVLAMEKGTVDSYASLYEKMKDRYRVSLQHGKVPLDFLVTFAYFLLNYGTFCLSNNEARRAINVLEESLLIFEQGFVMVKKINEAEKEKPSAEEEERTYFYASTHGSLVYLRMLLATAFLLTDQFSKAAFQYEKVAQINRDVAFTLHAQKSSGLKTMRDFSGEFVEEEVDVFFQNKSFVESAIQQQQAELLLAQAQSSESKVAAAQLALARLYRRTGEYSKSQKLYESFLDSLVTRQVEDSEYVMLELGRMLAFEAGKFEIGLVYIQSASSLMYECLEDEMPSRQEGLKNLSGDLQMQAYQTAAALVDTALALDQLSRTSEALGSLLESITLLQRVGLENRSCWIKRKYADLCCCVSFVDRAIEMYLEAKEVDLSVLQLGPLQSLVSLSPTSVEGSIAYCFQTYVGDDHQAVEHYKEFAQLSAKVGASQIEEVIFLYRNAVECAERIKDYQFALSMQMCLMEAEGNWGLDRMHSVLKYADILFKLKEYHDAAQMYLSVLTVADSVAMTSTELRVRGAIGLTLTCARLPVVKMGLLVLSTLQRMNSFMESADSATALVHFASLLTNRKGIDVYDAIDVSDISKQMESVKRLFMRTAELIVAQEVIDSADEAEVKAFGGVYQKHPKEYVGNCLLTLYSGASFFYDNGFKQEAQELEDLAIEIEKSEPIVVKEAYMAKDMTAYMMSFAIQVANTDMPRAIAIARRILTIFPDNVDVMEMVLARLTYVAQDDYDFAKELVENIVRRNPSKQGECYFKLMLCNFGAPSGSGTAQKSYEGLRNCLLALGVAGARVPSHTDVTEANFDARVDELDHLFVEGMSSCSDVQVIRYVCFQLQTKYQRKKKLLNSVYKKALKRFPDDFILLCNYAQLCEEFGYHSLARMCCAKSSALDPVGEHIYGCAAYLHHFYGDSQAVVAEAMYRNMRDLQPDGKSWSRYALCLASLAPTPYLVDACFRKALELDPKDAHTYSSYASFVWASTDAVPSGGSPSPLFDKAEQLFKKATELSSEPVHLQKLGSFYSHRSGRFEDAMMTLQKAHQMDPKDVTTVCKMCALLVAECEKVSREEANALLGDRTIMSPRLRALREATRTRFEQAIQLDGKDIITLSRYAQFATSTLRDTKLASDLFKRIEQLKRETSK